MRPRVIVDICIDLFESIELRFDYIRFFAECFFFFFFFEYSALRLWSLEQMSSSLRVEY